MSLTRWWHICLSYVFFGEMDLKRILPQDTSPGSQRYKSAIGESICKVIPVIRNAAGVSSQDSHNYEVLVER